MDTFAQRLKQARIDAGLSQDELAVKANVSQSLITKIESGRAEESRKTTIIAEILGVNPYWLATGIGDKKQLAISNAEWLGAISEWDNETPLDDDEVAIPFFREVELSAGNGKTHVIENHGNKLRFSKSTLKKAGVEIANAYCVMAKGNSMANVIPDGSTVGVDVGFKRIVDGKIYAIDHDGQLRIKIIYRLPGGGIRLKSYNEDEWPDEFYPTEPNNKITILGRVFWYSALLY